MTTSASSSQTGLEWNLNATNSVSVLPTEDFSSNSLFVGDLFGDDILDVYSSADVTTGDLLSAGQVDDISNTNVLPTSTLPTSTLPTSTQPTTEIPAATDSVPKDNAKTKDVTDFSNSVSAALDGLGAFRPNTSFNDFANILATATSSEAVAAAAAALTAASIDTSSEVSTAAVQATAVTTAPAGSLKVNTLEVGAKRAAASITAEGVSVSSTPITTTAVSAISAPVVMSSSTLTTMPPTDFNANKKRRSSASAKTNTTPARKPSAAEDVKAFAALAAGQVAKISRQSSQKIKKLTLRTPNPLAVADGTVPVPTASKAPTSTAQAAPIVATQPTTPLSSYNDLIHITHQPEPTPVVTSAATALISPSCTTSMPSAFATANAMNAPSVPSVAPPAAPVAVAPNVVPLEAPQPSAPTIPTITPSTSVASASLSTKIAPPQPPPTNTSALVVQTNPATAHVATNEIENDPKFDGNSVQQTLQSTLPGGIPNTSTAHVAALTSSDWVSACTSNVTPPAYAPANAITNADASAAAAAQAIAASKRRRHNLTPAERAKQNRDRNREHARNTRLRKKAYIEELKKTLTEVVAQRDITELKKKQAAQTVAEQREVRFRVIGEFLTLRESNNPNPQRWNAILDSNFTLTLPATAYRTMVKNNSTPVDVSGKSCDLPQAYEQVLRGPDVMADAALVAAMLERIGRGTVEPKNNVISGNKVCWKYGRDRGRFYMDGCTGVLHWTATTVGALAKGAASEIVSKGSLRAVFVPATNKLLSLEMMFDTGAIDAQLKHIFPMSHDDEVAEIHRSQAAETIDAVLDPLSMNHFNISHVDGNVSSSEKSESSHES